jgi:hypothetical protein
MASHQLIDDYLAGLARRLPADTLDELADGLIETWQHHLDDGSTPDEAAHAAIADFGSADQVAAEFIAQAPGRRTARLLLASGPILAACWGPSLVAAKVWTWPVPRPAAAAYVLAFLAVIACLLIAGASRRSYRRTRLGMAGALVLIGCPHRSGVTVAARAADRLTRPPRVCGKVPPAGRSTRRRRSGDQPCAGASRLSARRPSNWKSRGLMYLFGILVETAYRYIKTGNTAAVARVE